jgi:transcriptional regulator with PAS, ATPase and Fis domain
MARLAATDVPVLITGESGTGKEVIAQNIHLYSSRKDFPFVAVNCSAIPPTLLESELFGYEKGAFTGASSSRAGYFEQANKGTLFLDEIGELNIDLQVKLLRVLQESQIRRLGGKKDINLDIRFIFATNADLKKLVEEGNFRADLFYRLKVAEIRIPPLRERKDDILPLAYHFLNKYTPDDLSKKFFITKETEKVLLNYSFPGNVRELENIIRSSVVIARDTGVIMPDDLNIEQEIRERNITKKDILDALKKVNGNKTKAAKFLNIGRATLYRLLEKYNLELKK